MNKITLIVLVFIVACCGCTVHNASRVIVSPKHFKSQIPFQSNSKGIFIDTYWGSDSIEHKLYIDNHSPTWANDHVINNNPSISKSKEFLYSTTTADGSVISGDVYVCENIRLGNTNFKNVPFYNISNESNTGKTDGVIGENMMSEAVWKIDFKNQIICFASSIDSVDGLNEANLLPSVFTDNGIEIEVQFRHSITEKLEVDLGYNGWIILPAETSQPVFAGNKKIYTDSVRFSTPAGASIIKNTVAPDSIQIDHRFYNIPVTTNEMVKEKLIGLRFFNDFDFIVIDYLNKAVYLSKKKLFE